MLRFRQGIATFLDGEVADNGCTVRDGLATKNAEESLHELVCAEQEVFRESILRSIQRRLRNDLDYLPREMSSARPIGERTCQWCGSQRGIVTQLHPIFRVGGDSL